MNTLIPLLAAAIIAASGLDPKEADIAWIAKGEFCEPETVISLPNGQLLVSNVCDFRTTGNGFLTLMSPQGDVLDWRVVEGLDAPLGMDMLGDRLYVIDKNRVKVFDWPEFELQKTIDINSSVANDLAVSPDGTVYVTDTAKHQVIRLTPDGTQSVLTGKAQFKGANGIALADSHLLVGGERLWRVNLLDSSVETLGPDWLADIDGIEFEPDGTIQITPVAGPLVRYRGENDLEIIAGPGISSANHGFVAGLHLVLIPTGFDNTVIAIRLPQPSTTGSTPAGCHYGPGPWPSAHPSPVAGPTTHLYRSGSGWLAREHGVPKAFAQFIAENHRLSL